MNGLIVLAVAVAVLGCCLVFAVEDDAPRTAPAAPAAVVLDLRPRLAAAQVETRTDNRAGSKRTRVCAEGGPLRTTTLRPR